MQQELDHTYTEKATSPVHTHELATDPISAIIASFRSSEVPPLSANGEARIKNRCTFLLGRTADSISHIYIDPREKRHRPNTHRTRAWKGKLSALLLSEPSQP